MNRKLILVLLALTLILAAGLSGCGPSTQPEPEPAKPAAPPKPADPPKPAEPEGPVPGGTVYLTMWSEPEMFNPLLLRDTYSRLVAQTVGSQLVKYNADREVIGDLAESWSFSPDQTQITFKLRDNIKWHDGTPCTAHDVEFSLKSMMDPQYPGVYFSDVATILGADEYRAGEATDVPGLKVVDDLTLQITTKNVDAAILRKLTRGVVPKHILGSVPVENWPTHASNMNPIGTGPFKFVRYATSQYVELEAFDDYFLGRPLIDKIIWKIGDQNAMLAAFMNQEVDVINVPLPEVEGVEKLNFAQVHSYASGYQWLGMNLTQERFQDPQVRRALAYALNRNQIVKSLLRGYGFVLDIPFAPDAWFNNPDVARYDFDPAKAKELLDAAGWKLNSANKREKDGEVFKVTLLYPTGNLVRMQSAPIAQLNLQAIGIDCDIRALDFPTLVSRIQPAARAVVHDDYDIFLMGLSFELDPDLSILFHSKFVWPNGWNLSSYRSDKVDDLLDKGLNYVDPELRAPFYREFAATIADEVPVIYLYATEDVVAVNSRVNNVVPVPHTVGLTHNVIEWWIPTDQRK